MRKNNTKDFKYFQLLFSLILRLLKDDIDIDAHYPPSWEIFPTTPATDGARDDWRGRTSCAGMGTMIRPKHKQTKHKV